MLSPFDQVGSDAKLFRIDGSLFGCIDVLEITKEDIQAVGLHLRGQIIVSGLRDRTCLRMIGCSPGDGGFVVRDDSRRLTAIVFRDKHIGEVSDRNG